MVAAELIQVKLPVQLIVIFPELADTIAPEPLTVTLPDAVMVNEELLLDDIPNVPPFTISEFMEYTFVWPLPGAVTVPALVKLPVTAVVTVVPEVLVGV